MLRRIAIVEDQTDEAERLISYFERYSKGKQDTFQITRFETGNQFITRYQPIYDAVFMDIMMPGTNGMDIAQELRKLDSNVILVFVTNMAQFAVRGYEVEAFDFVVKPITYQNFVMKIQRVLRKIKNEQRGSYLLLSLPEGKKGFCPLKSAMWRWLDIRYFIIPQRRLYHLWNDESRRRTTESKSILPM